MKLIVILCIDRPQVFAENLMADFYSCKCLSIAGMVRLQVR